MLSKKKIESCPLQAVLLCLLILGISYHTGRAKEFAGKLGGTLLVQLDVKKDYLRDPTPGKLAHMKRMGLRIDDPSVQMVYLHFSQEPSLVELEELRALGARLYPDSWIPPVGAHPYGFLVAEMPIDRLEDLAAKDFVMRIGSAERVDEPLNDQATADAKADSMWAAGYDGTGVTVAILDSGIDTTHADLPTAVALKDYSNWPVLDNTIANTVTGHGTHVAGSVLGRGTQSLGGTAVYKGSAPGADMVFLKIGSDATGSASWNAIIYAMRAAVDTYNVDVVTMSYGGWDDYHDGSATTCQAADYAVSQGAVVFISAGNDADEDEHYSGTVAANDSTGYIQVDVGSCPDDSVKLFFNLVWYDGLANNRDLELKFYNSSFSPLTPTAYSQTESPRGTESQWFEYPPPSSYIPAGPATYYLRVRNNSVSSQAFHIYYSSGLNLKSGDWVTFNSADPFYTVGTSASADSVIAVAAHVTRQSWVDYEGNGPWWFGYFADDIAGFSSRGPRIDGVQKPDISAGGSAVISLRDDDVYTWPPAPGIRPYVIDNDGVNLNGSGPADYYVMQGTSMSCPIAAGAAALLLDHNPGLTPSQVRQTLYNNARSDAYTGAVPNDTWGYGKLDVMVSMAAPGISVFPDTLKFGQVQVGGDSTLTLRVKSTGSDTLKVTDIDPSDPVLALSDTAFNLAPSESTDVTVTFTPASVQAYVESLTILHNAKGSTVVPVLGEGVGNVAISVSPDTLKFGQVQVGGDSSLILRVKSTGTDTLKVTDIDPSDPVLALSDTAFNLAPSESTDVTVTFTPASAQAYVESLMILHNAKGTTVVPVTGEGISGVDLSIATDDIQFDPISPVEGDTVTIEARVHNVTSPKSFFAAVESVLVRFYDGDPDIAGIQIGADQIIPTIEPDSSEVAQVQWHAAVTGQHQIHVLVDPEDQVQESNEGNNRAHKAITVLTKPVVLSMILSDPSPTAAGEVDFTFTFDRKMDVAVAPTASYGLASPYDAHAITADPGWAADSTTWTGSDTIEAAKGDGLNTARIEGAQDPGGHAMETDTSWTFFIDTQAPISQVTSPRYSGSKHFTVSWPGADPAPASGVATYAVYVLVDGLFPSAWFSDTTDTTAIYTGSNGHFYSFYSQATDSAGNEEQAPGTPDCTTYVDTSPPAVPALLSPLDEFITGDNMVTFIWGQVTKGLRRTDRSGTTYDSGKFTPVTYQLQVARDQLFTDLVVDTSGLADTTFSMDSPLPDTSYFWQIQATDMAQHSSGFQATPFKFTVDTQPPQISGTTVWPDTGFGGPFMVESLPYDPSDIGLALLWYRTNLDTFWRADTMWIPPLDHYVGEIPEQTTPNTTVDYYVYAEDGAVPPNSQTDPVGAPGAGVYSFTALMTPVQEEPSFQGIPKKFALYQNYPDPFNAGTEILYALPEPCYVRLEIFNVLGQRVIVLEDGLRIAGYHTVRWDGQDARGQPVASGIYLYRLRTERHERTRKMVVLR